MNKEENRKSVENDALREMFEKQISFQRLACGIDVPEDLPDKFYLQTTACIVELCEAIQTDNRWKVLIGGKRKEKNNSADKLDELVDAMHFLINAVLYSGFSYEEFVEAFKEKNNRNIKRQILKNE